MTTIINGSSPSITFSDGSAQTSATRPFLNRLINGGMTIDQRNAGASVTVNSDADFYPVDRWVARGQNTDGVFTAQQSSTAPVGFVNSVKYTVTTADSSVGATQYYFISQRIEGYNVADLNWGGSNAKTVTLSFWVQSSVTGTYGGCLSNSGNSRSYPFTYTISAANTWEQKSVTIAGDQSGTWLTTNGVGLLIYLGLGVGSTYNGTAGAWAGATYLSATGSTNWISTNGATFYITGVQLEVGSTATSFDYRPYTTELQLCERYYEKSYNVDVVPATNTGAGRVYVTALYQSAGLLDYGGSVPFRVSKRANPTISYWREDGTSGSWEWATATGSGNLTTIVTNRVGTTAFSTYATGSGFTNTPFVISGHWVASTEL